MQYESLTAGILSHFIIMSACIHHMINYMLQRILYNNNTILLSINIGIVVLTLIVNLFRIRKISMRQIFIMVRK